MKFWIVGILLVCCRLSLPAQEMQLDGMNEYVISDVCHFTILSPDESRMERKYQAVILNDYAEDLNRIILPYDKFTKIASLKVSVCGMDGKVIKRYSLKDCRDVAVDLGAVASESRIKYLKVVQGKYPYMLHVEYRVDDKGSMFYPSWTPVGAEKQGIKEAKFIVSDPQNVGFRYRNGHVGEPRKEPEGNGFRYTWEIRDMKPITMEPFSGNLEDVMPVVYMAATDFVMGGYKGNMESWENYGKWINQLFEGKEDLKPEQFAGLKQQCDQLSSVREKVRAIYQYVQKNTRYVSIQLGMGGWQPFAASYVHQHKYGDCKALSFYTYALLKAMGIPSYYTLIRAGRDVDEIPEDFPTARFNHAIVTVPLEQDTIWLECTSKTSPMGYMGTFTSDRNCLLVGKDGGRLVRTRKYREQDNVRKTNVQLQLLASGDARMELCRILSGLEIEENHFYFTLNEAESEKRKWILDHADYGTLELADYRFMSLSGDEVPYTGYEVKGNLRGFCSASAGRLFVTPFVFSNIADIRLAASERESPIVVRYPYTQTDTVHMILPEGFQVENGFQPMALSTSFGEYRTSVGVGPGKISVIRHFCLKSGVYPKTDYDEFKAFITKVQLGDRNRIVLVGKR